MRLDVPSLDISSNICHHLQFFGQLGSTAGFTAGSTAAVEDQVYTRWQRLANWYYGISVGKGTVFINLPCAVYAGEAAHYSAAMTLCTFVTK